MLRSVILPPEAAIGRCFQFSSFQIWILFLMKLEGLQFYKKGTTAQVFSCKYCEIFRNSFFYRTPPVAICNPFLTIHSSKESKTPIIGKYSIVF